MNDELYHYGVPGMKWGVRRSPSELGHKPKKSKKAKKKSGESFVKKFVKKAKLKKAASKKKDPVVEDKKDPISSLSNEELRARIERANLERQYRDLHPRKVSKGEAFTRHLMDKVIVPAATEASKSVVKDFLVKQGKAYLGMNGSSNSGGSSGGGGGSSNQNGNRNP